MSQAARKTHQFSIVRSDARSDDPAPAPSLKEYFGGWLDSIAPGLSGEPSTQAPAVVYRNHPITSTDIVRVNRATVRESTDHRHWPADVVAQFLAAEVIRKREKST